MRPFNPVQRGRKGAMVQNGSSAPATGREILDADALGRTLARLAHELIERNHDVASLALVGIHTRGVPLARRLGDLVAERSGLEPLLGAVDISFHRDDVLVRAGGAPLRAQPLVRAFGVEGAARASLAPYSQTSDVDALLEGLDGLVRSPQRFVDASLAAR